MSFIAGYVPAPGIGADARQTFILNAADRAQKLGADHFGFQDAGGAAIVMGQTFTGGMIETPQPYRSADRTCCLAFSGVLYNAGELQSQIAPVTPLNPAMRSGEILLHLYQREGEDAFARLAGAYTFCLWDAGRGRLFVGRDGSGLGRLYVAKAEDGVRFSSDAALVGAPATAPGAATIVQFLAFGTALPGGTAAAGPWSVDPGGYLRVEDGRVSRWNTAAAGIAPDAEADGDLGAALGRTLRSALRLGRAPAGVLVSGGLYAGALTAALGDVYGAVRGVTVGLPMVNEFPYAGLLGDGHAVPVHEVEVTVDEVLGRLDSVLAAAPSPVDDVAALLLCLAVEGMDAGVKTLFTGIGARELFGDHAWEPVEPADVRALLRRPADMQETRKLDKWIRALPAGQPLPVTDATLLLAERRAAMVSAAAAARGMTAVHPFLGNPALKRFAQSVCDGADTAGISPRAALRERLGVTLPPLLAGRDPAQPVTGRDLLLSSRRDAISQAVAALRQTAAADVIDTAETSRLTDRFYAGEAALAPLVWRLYVLARWLGRR